MFNDGEGNTLLTVLERWLVPNPLIANQQRRYHQVPVGWMFPEVDGQSAMLMDL